VAEKKLKLETIDFYAPRFEVKIEGEKIPSAVSKIIKEVRVEEEKDLASRFSIIVNDEYDTKKGEFKGLAEDSIFEEGNEVTIKMGYGGKLPTMLIGRIDELESNFFSGDAPTLTLSGFDFSCEFRKPSKAGPPFPKISYSKIVEQIAKDKFTKDKFTLDIHHTEKLDTVISKKNDISDYKFIMELAKKCSREFGIDRETLYFVKSQADKDEIVTLEWGKHLISFNPRMRLSALYSKVEVRGHNSDDPKKPISGIANPGDESVKNEKGKTGSQIANELCPGSTKVVTVERAIDNKKAEEIALSIIDKASKTLFTGSGECIGIPQIKPQVTIRIENVGKKFCGKYYVESATHVINDSGYRTNFKVNRNSVKEECK
jgi:hypothetical protein